MFLLDYPYCKAELSDALQEKKKALITREGGGTAPLSALIGDYLLPSHPFRLREFDLLLHLSVKYQATGG